jgi:DNA repair protein RadC
MKNAVKIYELKKIQTNFQKVKIINSKLAYEFIKQFYGDDIEIFESFFILLLNRNNETIGYAKISQGGISGTIVDIRLIAKYAVESLCSSIVLAHNHPSGNLNPSEQDKNITSKIKDALNMFEISVIDHIILTSESFYSFADNGTL